MSILLSITLAEVLVPKVPFSQYSLAFKLLVSVVVFSQRHADMDRVPAVFIEEVLLLLEEETFSYKEPKKYPSIWGKIYQKTLDIKRVKVFFSNSGNQAVFSVNVGRDSAPLEELEQCVIRHIKISDEDEDFNTKTKYPLTEANYLLLRKVLRKGYPCKLKFLNCERWDQPLIEQLCFATPRITHILTYNHLPSTVDVVTRSVERRILRCFIGCAEFQLTEEMFSIYLRYVASEELGNFEIGVASDSPVSYEEALERTIDAVLRKEGTKRFIISVAMRARSLCRRLETEEMRDRFRITSNYENNYICVQTYDGSFDDVVEY
uniref:FTH domain-containing protein n=1 Tax=Steinernema glaseri TaxID=37863 RepID=A0A1I7ZQJ8_9BILA